MILMGFLVAPRPPIMAPVVIDGNGRRGREEGNDGFRMGRGREACREGEVGEASGDETSGDETSGRFVLIVSDMPIRLVRRERGQEWTGTRVRCGIKESGDI